ncbi:hypothetical protein HO173_007023 [Letharia columbiana]|uniref:Glycosyltransferase family 2 protein n=1 Tax=Letharia columbiana TaxID=112416 RepID=A0A8H6FU36_9LECA|nr:uncharacterized protein HO173_007023 [Letharia columbiana]KAF6234803.1 hypothetical protein HO173_007023 [Letharia columbiana]
MLLQDTGSPAYPDWLALAIVFTLLLPLLSSRTVRYQPIWYISLIVAIDALFSLPNTKLKIFVILFLFRYVRLIVNLTAFCLYKPVAIPTHPSLTAKDVTVIVPTVAPYGKDFEECIQSIQANGPAKIVIVTAGPGNYERAIQSVDMSSNILIKHCHVQNKRAQVCEALEDEVHTTITVLCDDHVFWPRNFLPSILAPFEDPNVGCVGTSKRVRRTVSNFSLAGFWNFLGCLYLERHNFEIAATNAIDGGVFVISGRTSAHRTEILQPQLFRNGFLNDYILFGLIGPLNADDDNFITRWMVNHGWKLKIQYSEDACIETTLGEYPKYLFQCMRWARTTWRSNPLSLLSRRTWTTQPWSIYAVFLTSFINFALFYDVALLTTLRIYLTDPASSSSHPVTPATGLLTLGLWILCSKLVKPWPHFRRHPRDLAYLPGYILFGYFHSLLKLWALLTFWNVAWGSRPLGEGVSEGVNGGMGGDVISVDDAEGGVSEGVNGGMGGDAARMIGQVEGDEGVGREELEGR